MQDTNTLIEILTDLVKGFTRHHADLIVTDSQPTKHSLVISFQPHADDIGKIIGEGGCNVKALQIIAAAMGLALALKVRVEVQEPVVGQKMRQDPYKANPAYKIDDEMRLLERLGAFIFGEPSQVEYHADNGEKTSLILMVAADLVDSEELGEALDTIFRATGLSKGRKLAVELETL